MVSTLGCVCVNIINLYTAFLFSVYDLYQYLGHQHISSVNILQGYDYKE